jgi:trehalose synthase
MTARISVGDVVLLHDPQTAGMVDRLRAAGAHVVWQGCRGLGRGAQGLFFLIGLSMSR